MSIHAQLCSYCTTLGHKLDKCSCPSLMDLFVRTVHFVQAINTTVPSREEQTAVWLNTQHPKKIKVLARNLKLTQNMTVSYNDARTSLIRHITHRRYSQDEAEFANRVSFRVGEGAEVMVEYRRIPQPPSIAAYRAQARIAVEATREIILGMSLNDRRIFLGELTRAQQGTVASHERFMEIYSGHQYQTGNSLIATNYVHILAHMVVQMRRHQPNDWDGYLRNVQVLQTQTPQPQVPQVQAPQAQAPPLPVQPQPPAPAQQFVIPPREIPQQIRNKAKVVKVSSFVMPFDCPICYEPVVGKCIITTCGHQYCGPCFEGISKIFDRHTGNNTCSMCRGVLSRVVECSVVEQSLASWMALKT